MANYGPAWLVAATRWRRQPKAIMSGRSDARVVDQVVAGDRAIGRRAGCRIARRLRRPSCGDKRARELAAEHHVNFHAPAVGE